ncbi:DUF3810 domain-containing protein [Chitinophaga filiformis]|uniref:DUF3810 domain-containing protein n=1 Tax=Chitinophaga filiformis TaxID=104663 RepID=A0ABY4HXX5_CHIFI|nr:DUF3810 domain-containing protein [Chitinophaga filiformis]UPK68673.1 DUF3810 domain-containing protein [Chitinophaga filiformis]
MDFKIKIKGIGIRILITVLCICLLQISFTFSDRFSGYYFHRLYSWISLLLRKVLGKVPFSVGDVIYAAWIITLIVYLLNICYKIIKRQWKHLGVKILQGIQSLLTVYLVFMLFWGYNYDRNSLEKDLRLDVEDYTTDQLYQLTDTLLQQVNQCKIALGDSINATHPGPDSAAMFSQAVMAYDLAGRQWPSLQYKNTCIKPSLYSQLLNYMGVGGYLNPFTGEAQVNVSTPGFLHPFTICHEVAHQLGYAPEQEANFVGYLVADHSPDVRFRYAANFEMFMYSVRQLRRQDTTLAGQLWRRTVPGIRADMRQMRDFYDRYRSPVDDYTTMIYDQYLKANNQEKGIHSYSEVVGWLIAYFKIR